MEKSEDFSFRIGKTTPLGFPAFTQKFSERSEPSVLPPEYPPVILVRQYYWPMLLPTTILQPTQNINYNLNCYPNNNIQYPSMIYANPPSMAPFIPCFMRQVPIQVQYVDYQKNYPQVIEAHNYVPANYFGGMLNQVNQWS